MVEDPELTANLPFKVPEGDKKFESVGTNVLVTPNGESVIKISKRQYPSVPLKDALIKIKNLRLRESLAYSEASQRTRESIIPQSYVLAQGSEIGTSRSIRTQKYVEGLPLKKIGFNGILKLPNSRKADILSILSDSMKFYLRHGTNYDLFGSDINDYPKNLRIQTFKRIFFPLGSSSNLLVSNSGVKLVDPNTRGLPDSRRSLKTMVIEGLIFSSTLVNYLILKASLLKSH